MKRIPPIPTADELLDTAFRRADKVWEKDHPNHTAKMADYTLRKMDSAASVLEVALLRVQDSFPSIDRMHPFFRELIEALIGVDRLKKSLGAVPWAIARIKSARKEAQHRVRMGYTTKGFEPALKAMYGRIASTMHQIDKDLRALDEIRIKFAQIPDVDPNAPTVVVAGCPNVGKSQLVGALSRAKPRVAPYPFTTTTIFIGHIEDGRHALQIIDTPGMLDRDPERLNPAERQALSAMVHLADLILFIYDPTCTCGYSMKEQDGLALRVRRQFTNVPILEIDNKSDMGSPDTGRMRISAREGAGVPELKERIVAMLRKTDKYAKQLEWTNPFEEEAPGADAQEDAGGMEAGDDSGDE